MKNQAAKSKKWTLEEETFLTDTVIQFSQKGRPQKEAFEEAAQHIGRTAGACSFRWNNKLRKNLQMEEKQELSGPFFAQEKLTLEDSIAFLQILRGEEELLKENRVLKEQKSQLQQDLHAAEETFFKLKDDYKLLLDAIKSEYEAESQ